MRALVLTGAPPASLAFVQNYPDPVPGAKEVLVRVDLAGVCATDLELARGYMSYTGVLGHEFVGTVLQGAPELHHRRVVGEINCPCGQCTICRSGAGRHCPSRTVLGISGRDGAFAEHLCIPAANCHIVPADLPDEAAVFVEPLAAAAHVLDAVHLDADTRVTVVGSGRLGLLVAFVLQRTACRLRVAGRNPRTLSLCRRREIEAVAVADLPISADQDVVVDCTGSPDGLRLALALCRPLGTIVLKSTYAEPAALDLAPLVIHELRVVGSRCGDFGRALALLAQGDWSLGELITGRYPMSQGAAALTAAAAPEHIKVLICPQE
ncbi:MAG: alcohol dehydrogenase catalytic domain-containing protein [Phycisphaerales bacterium]|nr:alcohol dehydrogenase catalytic domain-containing protein [Phycisphaerales bacterium]